MMKMYDALMKSGNFTAVQTKEDKKNTVNSIAELIEMCEEKGFVEKFYIDSPNDKVDFTIRDMQRYTRSLIEGESSNLENMIEEAIKRNQKEDEASSNMEEEDIVDDSNLEELELEDLDNMLSLPNVEEFNEFIESESLEEEEV